MDYLEPAATVIKMCGGINEAAKLVGIHRTVVYRWTQPKSRGGTGGQVPAHHAQRLLESKIPGLTPAHFFFIPRRREVA